MRYLKGFLIVFMVSVFWSCRESNKSPDNPNFLFILVDDLGYYDLSCSGSEYYETPNIDRIANAGMVFTNGYSTCQVCSPSRASILTGNYPVRHGITDYIGALHGKNWRDVGRYTKLLPPQYADHLPHEYSTLAETLKENGYRTFFAGKWHLGGEGSYPEDHGFEINKGGYEQGGPYAGGFFAPFNNPKMEDNEDERGLSLSMRLARETSNFISEHKNEKFLAYLSFYAVHAPIQTTEDKWKKYRDKAEQMGIADTGFVLERRLPIRIHQDNPVYAGLVEQMDEAVGMVLNTLKKNGLEENTVVIFTSDNGGVASGDDYATSNSPMRGGKGYQWEAGIKVPFFIHVPWLNLDGKKTETPVIGLDFYPTILSLAGIKPFPNEQIDGVNLLPVLKGTNIEPRALFWHYPHYGNQGGDPSSIIQKWPWKLIYYWEDGNSELYNLKDDVAEKTNLKEQHPQIYANLHEELMAWLQENSAKTPEVDPLYNEDTYQLNKQERINSLLPKLEEERKKMLENNWHPNEDWWGSKTTLNYENQD